MYVYKKLLILVDANSSHKKLEYMKCPREKTPLSGFGETLNIVVSKSFRVKLCIGSLNFERKAVVSEQTVFKAKTYSERITDVIHSEQILGAWPALDQSQSRISSNMDARN